MVIQLGHGGGSCPVPVNGGSNFVIMHTNGIHPVNIAFCGCPGTVTHRQQLLRHAWYPATVENPQTCATFALLNHFHLLTLQSKVSSIHFYDALVRETDNTGILHITVRVIVSFSLLEIYAFTHRVGIVCFDVWFENGGISSC